MSGISGSPPQLPDGEWDGDRHVHPYVQEKVDSSAPGFTLPTGEEVSAEQRSEESRLAFHVIEPLLGALSPLGLSYLIQACIHRLYSPLLEAEMAEQATSAAELDIRTELLPFEELHESDLKVIAEAIDRIVATCPGCGRTHSAGCDERLQPGAYVHTETGDAVDVRRVADSKVYAVAQIDDKGTTVSRVYERDWFEQHFVPADGVAVLGGPVE